MLDISLAAIFWRRAVASCSDGSVIPSSSSLSTPHDLRMDMGVPESGICWRIHSLGILDPRSFRFFSAIACHDGAGGLSGILSTLLVVIALRH